MSAYATAMFEATRDALLSEVLRQHDRAESLEAHIAGMQAAVDRSNTDGHNTPCYFCGEPINSLHGNPDKWGIPLTHRDDPGVVKYHHISCVRERLDEVARLRNALAAVSLCCRDNTAPAHVVLRGIEKQVHAALAVPTVKGG